MEKRLIGFLAFASIWAPCFAQSPKFNGEDIPVPPEQSKSWIPPQTKLSPAVISAITELFNDGMADPRGCEYREIEVKTGIELNSKTHGWILPDKDHFAVGWNGLVYPVATIGPVANVEKDVANMVAKDEKQWGSYTGSNRDVRGHWPVSEWVSISQENILPLKVAMLMRLGRTDLAESVWDRWFALSVGDKDDPYLLLAREWTESLYGRALFAHLRGDDALSLASCRTLVPLRLTIEATATQRGFPKEPSGKPYLEDLKDLPKLAADQERRATEQPYVPVLTSGQPAQGPERIAALIRDLELVNARQNMNPGQTDVSTDPIVHALIAEGDPAVEPLLKCFEEDTRLTRSEFTQGMQIKPGELIPVYEPAFVAVVGILKTPFSLSDSAAKDPRNLSLDDRKALAAKIRDYWDQYKSMTLPERWYATLEDDKADASAWFPAVANIVQPSTETKVPSTIFGGGWWSGGSPSSGTPVVLGGESLRGKSNPSVSDLIIKRFNELIARSDSDASITFDHLSDLLFALADWDGKAHFDDLRTLAAKLAAKFPHSNDGRYSTVQTTVTIYEKRVALGDPAALSEYCAWLPTLDPDETDWPTFKLMWQHPSDPPVQRAAQQLFTSKDSPWRIIPPQPPRFASDLITTPLIALPVFRQSLLDALENTTLVSGLMINKDGVNLDGQVRFCDYIALRLADVEEFPEMKFDWSEKQRDAAVERCKMLLQCYGNNYRYGPQDENQNPEPARTEHTAIAFAPLDHPATTEDVTQGLAIFALDGTTRLCKLPPFPISVQRPSKPEDPVRWSGDNGITYTYDTSGKIWQGEELQVDGKWQRYYGFAGRHQLEKVPASEIVFPSGYGWTAVSGPLDGKLEAEPTKLFPYRPSEAYSVVDPGVPFHVTLKVRNHSGLDQEVPASLVLPPNSTRMLPGGMNLNLVYSDRIPPEVLKPPNKPFPRWNFGDSPPPPPFDYGTWKELPLRKEITIAPSQGSGPVLGATNEMPLIKIDLRDFFDITRPGSYRLSAIFHMPGQADHKSNEISFSVAKTAD
jgi:hypothetical protein